jgi:hypothetical protein
LSKRGDIIKRAISHLRCLGKIGFFAARTGFHAKAGNASIELALTLSFFAAPMMLGTTEVAFLIYDSIEISNATQAGAVYRMMSPTFAGDSAAFALRLRAKRRT